MKSFSERVDEELKKGKETSAQLKQDEDVAASGDSSASGTNGGAPEQVYQPPVAKTPIDMMQDPKKISEPQDPYNPAATGDVQASGDIAASGESNDEINQQAVKMFGAAPLQRI